MAHVCTCLIQHTLSLVHTAAHMLASMCAVTHGYCGTHAHMLAAMCAVSHACYGTHACSQMCFHSCTLWHTCTHACSYMCFHLCCCDTHAHMLAPICVLTLSLPSAPGAHQMWSIALLVSVFWLSLTTGCWQKEMVGWGRGRVSCPFIPLIPPLQAVLTLQWDKNKN